MFKVHPSFVVFAWCIGCGDSFTAGGSGGAAAMAGAAAAGAPAYAGSTSSGGSESAGAAGEPDLGGAGASAGGVIEQGGSPGSAGSSAGSVGRAGNAGSGGSAGSVGSAGSAGAGADCETLKQDYQATLEKARLCSSGSVDQCSPSSTLPGLGCGCPVLVNSKSEQTVAAKRKYQALQAAHCVGGVTCLIACQSPTAAACAPESSGTATAFVCSAGIN